MYSIDNCVYKIAAVYSTPPYDVMAQRLSPVRLGTVGNMNSVPPQLENTLLPTLTEYLKDIESIFDSWLNAGSTKLHKT